MDFLGFGMARLLYIRPHAGQDYLCWADFSPSIKYNYIFVKCLSNVIQISARPQIWPEIGKKGQFKPKKDPPGILALGYYFFSFF